MSGQAEQRRDHAEFPQTTETRLRDVFAAYEKLETELLQHIAQLRLAGWLRAEDEYVAAPVQRESTEYNDGSNGTRYLVR
jgi:hypothetical protein